MLISKKVSFDAAHYLPQHQGKCNKVHGHHWVVELAVVGDPDDNGIAVDFSEIKNWLDRHVVELFDHSTLNSFMVDPTAENIASYIRSTFIGTFDNSSIEFAYVRVWETDNSMVELGSK